LTGGGLIGDGLAGLSRLHLRHLRLTAELLLALLLLRISDKVFPSEQDKSRQHDSKDDIGVVLVVHDPL
jgi:hypothetical protein